MSSINIIIHIDDQSYANEGSNFASWCESKGYSVCRKPNIDGVSDGLNNLWEEYCNEPLTTSV